MEEYSKEFMDAYKERLRRIENGETFDPPDIFGYGFAMSSTVAFAGDPSVLGGKIEYNGDIYKCIAEIGNEDKNE